jgi:diguanylate cyclase (GGDEF)-like protein/PAS domain S-box-containing protein
MSNNKKARCFTLLVVFSIGCFLSSILFYGSYKLEKERIKSLFEKAAAYRFRYIENMLDGNLSALESFADLYAASQKVERDEFDKFSQRLFLRYPYIFEFRWIVRVSGSERLVFEDAAHNEGLDSFKVKELDKNGNIITAGQRQEYFLLYYMAPSTRYNYDHSSLLGLNTASIAERWQAMQIARDTAALAATGEVKHFGEPHIRTSSRVFIPIYRKGVASNTVQERRENLVGFVSMLYRVDEMVKGALHGIPKEGIDITIYDVFEGEKKLLYFYPFSDKQSPGNKNQINKTNLVWSESFKVANRQWEVVCRAVPYFAASHRIILPWIIFAGGFTITLLLLLYLKNIIARARAIELLVNERTEQFKQAKERYENLVNNINLGIYRNTAGPEGHFLEVNPAIIKMFEANSREDFLKIKVSELYKDPHKRKELSDKIIKAGFVKAEEVELKTLKGRHFYGAVSAVMKKDEGDKIYFDGVIEDISERKNVEEKLKEVAAELRKANEELKKLDQLKSDFVSTVSHELRTPLSIMKEGVSLVLDRLTGEISEKTEKTLGMVFDSINRLNKIINDILDISKIEAGRVQLKKTLADIVFIVKDTTEKWKIEIEKKQQTLLLEAGQPRINMYFDVGIIIRVLNNLISNSVKYTPQGGWIKVGLIDRKDEVEIYVSDNGIGISDEDLPKVFGKFQQFSRSAATGAKGTGLGLAISKELVEAHEGIIRLETKLGAGSKFIFSLPKKDSETVFKEHILSGIKEASKDHANLSLIVMKIVQFGKVQQALGNDIAHNFLIEIENIIKKTLRRKADTVVRDTGELIILLFDADRQIAKTVKERIEEVIRNYLGASKEKIINEIALSIGFSVYPEDAKLEAELLTKARGIIKTSTNEHG